MKPITSQIPRRSQFVQPNPNIMDAQTMIPKMGTRGTIGVLNCRGAFGFFTRNIQMPAQTRINANNVPILVISPTISPGINAAKAPTKTKNNKFDLYGVLNFECSSEKIGGTNPSLLIE